MDDDIPPPPIPQLLDVFTDQEHQDEADEMKEALNRGEDPEGAVDA